MTHTVTTTKPMEHAARDVEAALAKRRFSVLWTLDVNETLAAKGFDLQAGRVRILEVCSAPRAKEALETNPLVANFLPCKVTLRDSGAGTEIGLPLPTALMALVGDDRLRPLAEEVERAMIDAAEEAARV
jgi:uncharacterized protein (DUF302 family)